MRALIRGSLGAVVGLLLAAVPASAGILEVSADPFTNPTSQHATQVEPDTLAVGSIEIGAFQSGRFFDGGASDIGFARSADSGKTWTHGFLPGITKQSGNGPYDRASDPSVAYDAKHKVWLISSLPLVAQSGPIQVPAVLVSRSTDGGLSWGGPVKVTQSQPGQSPDKNWSVCDNTPTSPFYGHCYTTWDDNGNGNLLQTSTSTDGGVSWGPVKTTADHASGIGAQPLVQPNGHVIVPLDGAFENTINAYHSTDGGATWSATKAVASILTRRVAGGLRAPVLPSAEIDRAGKVYVSWYDCRFRPSCSSNDIVYSTSTDGVTWSGVKRVPIDAITSTVDHFIPGLAVDRATSGASAHLALTYYYYPVATCTSCRLYVGFIASNDGGVHWTKSLNLGGPMSLSWLASTSQGVMVGDYISTSFANGTPHPLFADAVPPSASRFREAMYTYTGLPATGGPTVSAAGDRPAYTGKTRQAGPLSPPTAR